MARPFEWKFPTSSSIDSRGLLVNNPEFGSIHFYGVNDLSHCPDFFNAIRFSRGIVDVDSDFGDGILDCPARVCLHGIFFKESWEDSCRILSDRLCNQNAEFVSYNPVSGTCEFQVEHFSRYGLFSDDDEEEDEASQKMTAAGAAAAARAAAARGAMARAPVPLKGFSVTPAAAAAIPIGFTHTASEGAVAAPAPAATGTPLPHGRRFALDDDDDDEAQEDGEEDGEEMSAEDFSDDSDDDEEATEHESVASVDDDDDELVEDPAFVVEVQPAAPSTRMSASLSYLAPSLSAIAMPPPRRTLRFLPAPPRATLVTPRPIPACPAGATATSSIPTNVVDTSVFLRRSVRVGWGPGGLLVLPRAGVVGAVRVARLDPTPHVAADSIEEYQRTLAPLLELTSVVEVPGTVPGWRVPDALTAIKVAEAVAARTLASASSAMTRQAGVDDATLLHFVCRLIGALWGPEQEHDPLRRESVKAWLCDYARVTPPIHHVARDSVADSDAVLAEILESLCVGDTRKACELALSEKDYRLAMLLTNVESSSLARDALAAQLSTWLARGLSPHISTARLRLYVLLSGAMIWPRPAPAGKPPSRQPTISAYATGSWARGLLQQIVFASPPQAPLAESLLHFEAATACVEKADGSSDIRFAALPLPACVPASVSRHTNAAPPARDACFLLLKLFARVAVSPTQLLAPEASTLCTLDHRVGFLLHALLPPVAPVHELSGWDAAATQVCVEHAAQLEAAGRWHWAVFVLQHLCNADVRTSLVRSLLWRVDWSRFPLGCEEREFLVQYLHVPLEEIAAAAMVHAKARFDYEAQVQEALGTMAAGRGALLVYDAHAVYVEHVVWDHVLTENWEAMNSILALIKASDEKNEIGFSTGGEVFGRYGRFLLQARDGVVADAGELVALVRGLAVLRPSTPRQRLCLGEMATLVVDQLSRHYPHVLPALQPVVAALPIVGAHRRAAPDRAALFFMHALEAGRRREAMVVS